MSYSKSVEMEQAIEVATNAKGLNPSILHTLNHIGEAYGVKVQAVVYRLADATMDSVDAIMALIPAACDEVFATHFKGMKILEGKVLDSTEIGQRL